MLPRRHPFDDPRPALSGLERSSAMRTCAKYATQGFGRAEIECRTKVWADPLLAWRGRCLSEFEEVTTFGLAPAPVEKTRSDPIRSGDLTFWETDESYPRFCELSARGGERAAQPGTINGSVGGSVSYTKIGGWYRQIADINRNKLWSHLDGLVTATLVPESSGPINRLESAREAFPAEGNRQGGPFTEKKGPSFLLFCFDHSDVVT